MGAKRLFPPNYVDAPNARAALLNLLHQSPNEHGLHQTRWTLEGLLSCCAGWRVRSLGGLSKVLVRLGIRRKRARAYLHSPDPDYNAKVAYLHSCQEQARTHPEHVVLVYLDEFAFERQPTLSSAYVAQASKQPLAQLSYRSNTQCRGVGAINALTGQLTYAQRGHITAQALTAFYRQLCQAYPHAQTIYVVQDNWPVHVYPSLLAALQPQQSPFWPRVPDNWPTQPPAPGRQAGLPIQLVFLPTYAPWLNPIEKVWRWVRQDVLHLHRLSDAWESLKQRVLDFMAQFALGSQVLLRYVGLLPY